MNELVVLLEGHEVGIVLRKGDRLQFTYNEDWRRADHAYPLSLSMPLTARSHGHREINAFIWGLLPDNERTLDRWAREFHVSARNGFALIGNVGEDCAGAVQFVRPDKLETVEHGGTVEWIDETEVARRLRSVVIEAGTGRTPGDNGQFSLAGAQPKTALLKFGNRWGIPSGRIPTTHILKPPSAALPGHAENEHLCLLLASALGLRTAESRVVVFGDQPAICVTRYDRISLEARDDNPTIARLHQEDMCQALGIHPERKYQSEGGPSAADILKLIRNSAADTGRRSLDPSGAFEDSWSFTDALIFNWLVGGTDGHAKNYSFLLGRGLARLAPLYDIASAYGFENLAPQRMKLAMKISRHYRVENIILRHWCEWAGEVGFNQDAVVSRVREMALRLPEALAKVAGQMKADGLHHPVIERLQASLSARAERVGRM